MITKQEIEDLIDRTAEATADKTAKKVREEVSSIFIMLGFNMDPKSMHEEQQVIAFARSMQQGTKYGIRAIIGAIFTALVGWLVWFFTGHRSPY